MLSKNKLAKLFKEPSSHTNDIIQDQLERMEVQFDYHLKIGSHGNALSIYQEYVDWIEAEEGSTYGFMLLERIC